MEMNATYTMEEEDRARVRHRRQQLASTQTRLLKPPGCWTKKRQV
jgi:hypothetical protein